MEVVTYRVAVTTAGEDGSATGSASSPVITGELLDVDVNYHADAPATTDVTLAYATRGGNILVLTDSATDSFHALVKQASNATGGAISGEYRPIILDDAVTVSVAGCDALTNAVVVTIRARR